MVWKAWMTCSKSCDVTFNDLSLIQCLTKYSTISRVMTTTPNKSIGHHFVVFGGWNGSTKSVIGRKAGSTLNAAARSTGLWCGRPGWSVLPGKLSIQISYLWNRNVSCMVAHLQEMCVQQELDRRSVRCTAIGVDSVGQPGRMPPNNLETPTLSSVITTFYPPPNPTFWSSPKIDNW